MSRSQFRSEMCSDQNLVEHTFSLDILEVLLGVFGIIAVVVPENARTQTGVYVAILRDESFIVRNPELVRLLSAVYSYLPGESTHHRAVVVVRLLRSPRSG